MAGLFEARTLVASAARTATGNGTQVDNLWNLGGHHHDVDALALVLDVTAAATDAGDLLDVYVQTMLDGTNWLDIARFAQVLGNGGAKRYVLKLDRTGVESEFEAAAALSASSVRDLLGSQWRARWVVTDADADASFTFSVTAIPM